MIGTPGTTVADERSRSADQQPTGGAGRVGYYVHHVGSGHLHRATALATALVARGVAVTGLSSLEQPPAWPGEWVRLDSDVIPRPGPHDDVDAHGRLHWAPLYHGGLARRMAQISQWLDVAAPDVVVTDVSQEVSLLARLHGVPVVSVLLPGRRDDTTHQLGLEISSDVVAFWPASAHGMSPGLSTSVEQRLHRLGGISRFAPQPGGAGRPERGTRQGVVLSGTGGGGGTVVATARSLALAHPDWSWRVLSAETWVENPWAVLCAADVVVTHAGQNAVAEVAAARVPAVVVAQARPHDEQLATAHALEDPAWPVRVVDADTDDLVDVLEDATGLDGEAWSGWVDGRAADRFCDLVLDRCRAREHR